MAGAADSAHGAARRSMPAIALSIGALSLPAVLGHPLVARAASLHELAAGPNPYFVPQHALLLYVAVPIVALSACVLFLAPGLFLALALGRARHAAEWVLSGLALTIPVISVAAAIAQGIGASPVRGTTFALVVAACAVAAALLAARSPRAVASALAAPASRATLISLAVLPVLLAIAMAPKFLWENFNGDGAHAYESARLLLVRPVPFWPESAGPISGFPGLTSMLFAYPASWFIRLFGPLEMSARLPLLLYLQGLVAALLALAWHGRRSAPRPAEPWLISLALVVYAVTMAYSATYNPYAADIALPATQDTLLVVCFLGFVLSFVRGELGWLTLFGVLTYVSLPSGLILIGFWMLAAFLVVRPRPWRALVGTAVMLAGCVIGAALLSRLLAAAELPLPGGEYGITGVLRYFAFLQFTDLQRLWFVIVPCGIVPALALLAWRRQDEVGRALTLVTLAYFLFFFVQANISLHHFVPAMLLPIVVFWRLAPESPVVRLRWNALTALGATVALLLALPASGAIDLSGRRVGESIAWGVEGYERLDPDGFRHSTLLNRLFPFDWDPSVPGSYGGSPLVWHHYARRDSTAPREANYTVLPSAAPAPAGMRPIASDDGATLYVRSDAEWNAHRALRPPTPAGSRVFRIRRGILFRSVPLDGGPAVIDVVATLERAGIDMGPILERLGVER